ncbi:MAG: amidohydrolase family protein [Pirellulales bacterium]
MLNDQDREFFQRELASFLPPRVFDAHAHLWLQGCVDFSLTVVEGPVGRAEYESLMAELHPERSCGALFLSFATTAREEHRDTMNQWVASQVAGQPSYRGHFFVRPYDNSEWVRDEVRRLGLHGLKCYHTFANVEPTWQAEIPRYLPEPLVQIAHEEAWTITLHIVRDRGLADASNQHWIRRYCERYPAMRLILAHSGRGFQPAHNLEGLESLRGLDNLYFDTSANCEPIAHQAIIRTFGHERLMYGSDLPVSHMRGRHLGVADSFLWLYEDMPVWDVAYGPVRPVLIGLEHLRSLKWACWSERLSDSAVEDIFYHNAARVFGLS